MSSRAESRQPIGPASAGERARLRLRYEKIGPLRFLSHKEVARALERAASSGGLPMLLSGGFHPHPRLSFGTVLPVGWSGRDEYVDFLLKQEIAVESAIAGLNEHLPNGLAALEGAFMPLKCPALMAAVARHRYWVRTAKPFDPARLAKAFEGVEVVEAERKGRMRSYAVAGSIALERMEVGGFAVSQLTKPLGTVPMAAFLARLSESVGVEFEVIEVMHTHFRVRVDHREVSPLQ